MIWCKRFPPDVVGEISKRSPSFSSWVFLTSLTDPIIKNNDCAINFSAKALLEHWKFKLKEQQCPKDQLLTIVFQESFKSMSIDEQTDLIGKMKQCQTEISSFSFKAKLLFFRIQGIVATFFGNSLIQLILGIIVARQLTKSYIYAKNYYDSYATSYYIPKIVNLFMSHAPLFTVRGVSFFIMGVQWIVNNPIKIRTLCAIAERSAGPYKNYVEKITNVISFPLDLPLMIFTFPFIIFYKSFAVSQSIQENLAKSAKEGKEGMTQQMIRDSLPEAYQLWMELMKHPDKLYIKR